MAFDPSIFLSLPLDLRQNVYWHLDGQLTRLQPPSKYELFTSSSVDSYYNSHGKQSKRSLKKKFEEYIQIFDYLPGFVETWLEYSKCLRFDCIVLDYLRVNLELDCSFTSFEWILLNHECHIAMFSPKGVLQVWYNAKEYREWVDPSFVPSTKLNAEHLTSNSLKAIIKELDTREQKDLVKTIVFFQEEDIYVNKSLSPIILSILSVMDSLRGLNRIKVMGEHLFGRLVNLQGARDYPGQSISYIVRKRVQIMEVNQGLSVGGGNQVADFSRWENLTKLTISEINDVDLKNVLLPKSCKWIVFRNLRKLGWWDQTNMLHLIDEKWILKSRRDAAKSVQQLGSSYDSQIYDENETLRLVDVSLADRDILLKCKAILWDTYGSLNYIQLIDVASVEGDIYIPRTLYCNKRMDIFRTPIYSLTLI
ncbi:LAFE_0H15632g1_1 [Lachancea fermentati]|uniref:LAFE_0H15632g1_1 n=1 Tax=Lachancea fermentati TaxID=4955 RepID=A0A1G4MKY5_LACFM|nr:LAFE_0H15632g1_1 [Lachancea fermentati]